MDLNAAAFIGRIPFRWRDAAAQFVLKVREWSAKLVRPPRPATPRTPWPLSGRLALAGAALLFAFGATVVLIDAWAVTEARHLPRWLVRTFADITEFGRSSWLLWPIGLVLIALAAVPLTDRFQSRIVEALFIRCSFLFAAIAVPGLTVSIVKRLIGRARPYATGTIDPLVYAPGAWEAKFASLPSGHATTAFAAAVAFGALWPRARLRFWAYAVLVALSRVILTAHHPSDVIVGAAVGVWGALLIRNWFAARRLGFCVLADGTVTAFPLPSRRRVQAVARAALAR